MSGPSACSKADQCTRLNTYSML